MYIIRLYVKPLDILKQCHCYYERRFRCLENHAVKAY